MRIDTSFIRGIIPPLLTPIDESERIDEVKLRDQVDFVISGGVHGILVFGSNGEFYAVDEAESKRGLQIVLDQAAGRVPVYYGIGAIATRACVRLAQMAVTTGAAAISVLQPMFLKPERRELLLHFQTIARSVGETPVLLYNNPARAGYSLTAELVAELAERENNIAGLKDTSGDMTLTAECIRLTRGSGFQVLGGKDTLLYATLAHGGAGGVVTTANLLPELVCSIYEKWKSGDAAGALEAQYRLNPIRLSMDTATFPVAAKDMAALLGRNMGVPYKPALPSSDATLIGMRRALCEAGYLKE